MEAVNVKNLSFRYNQPSDFTLKNISFSINAGDFLLIIGESGSGKTTLLKTLKRELTPSGELKGEIFFKGNKIKTLSKRDSSSKIGFIMQDPDSQIVTDRVYSELAFGLENLGVEREKIRSKVAEFAAYFGLEDKFERHTNTLSGGEKQLLNLASVMAMNPELIILDEPTSMLDPISALEFINCLKRVNEDLGTTVIIAEHHLTEVLNLADKAAYLENGRLELFCEPSELCGKLRQKRIEYTFPPSVRVFNKLNGKGEPPLTIKSGREFLRGTPFEIINNSNKEIKTKSALSLKDVWFRYERKDTDVLKGCSLKINEGEVYSLVGSNGSGKSTLVNIISQNLKPYRGKVKCALKTAVLPQNPRDLFVKDKLEDDFKLINNSYLELCRKFEIDSLLSRHPYDLSGGEIQRAAIVKILLSSPKLILLDEPTKGLDSFLKKELGEFIRSLEGVTVMLVTHDLEFAASYSDRCGLLFDGAVMSEDFTRVFFLANDFYTTSVVKLTKGIKDGAVTVDDIVES